MPPPPPPAPPPASANPPAPAPSALLKSIQKGTKLKKVVTNDRSQPVIEGNRTSVNTRDTGRPSVGESSGPQLGGLFAGGIPKLKPAGSGVPAGNKPKPAIPLPNNPVPAFKVASLSNLNEQEKAKPIQVKPPPVPAARQAPPPPARASMIPPHQKQASYNKVEEKPILKPAPKPVSPKAPRIPPPAPSRTAIVSPPSSNNDLTEFDGRWTWHLDIPLARQFPSGEEPRRSSRVAPPAPLRSSVTAYGKRPPPPPPPR